MPYGEGGRGPTASHHMAFSHLLAVKRLPRTQLFLDRFVGQTFVENCEYWSKLDETWSESYRVGRSGASGRRPRAEFGPKQTKQIKIKN